ncbi:hypothetical protein BGZ73_002612 [Actinomortierella ambigua]|nr:hypothetical protein BGZ73_002612 [Actinomortierella ambigua]
MTSTARMTRVSSRIAANQLLQQQLQQEQELQRVAASTASNSAAQSRNGSVSSRPGSRAGSVDSFADEHRTNGQQQHDRRENDEGHSGGEEHFAGDGSGNLDQGDETTEIDHAAFQDRSVLSTWEFAFIYGFLLKFKQLLRQNYPLHTISEQDLETALFSTSANDTIEQIHCNLLSNMQNRKKAVEKSSWQRALSEALDSKVRSGELEFHNPLRYYHNYYLIPPADRIQILKSLVDWVLQESTTIRQGLEEAKDTYLVQPFGTDQKPNATNENPPHTTPNKRTGFILEGSTKMYKESNPNKKNAKWETVASSLEDIRQLNHSFEKTASNVEKALRNRIQTEIIEPIEEKQRAERAEKKMLRLARFHEMAAMRTTRTRSSNRTNVVKYNYDDDDEDFEAYYDDEVVQVTPSRRGRGQQSEPQEYHAQPEPVVEGGGEEGSGSAMEMDAPSMTSDGLDGSHSRTVEEDEDRLSDTSISIALEKTRVGDAPETDRSPKRMKIEVDQMPVPAPMPTLLPFATATATATGAPAPSSMSIQALLSDPVTKDTTPITLPTTTTSISQPPSSAAQ